MKPLLTFAICMGLATNCYASRISMFFEVSDQKNMPHAVVITLPDKEKVTVKDPKPESRIAIKDNYPLQGREIVKFSLLDAEGKEMRVEANQVMIPAWFGGHKIEAARLIFSMNKNGEYTCEASVK